MLAILEHAITHLIIILFCETIVLWIQKMKFDLEDEYVTIIWHLNSWDCIGCK
jgi:hypothetical protein